MPLSRPVSARCLRSSWALFVMRGVLCCHIHLILFVLPVVGHGDGLTLQPFLELRIALGDGDMTDSIPQGALLTDDNADFLGTGDGGVFHTSCFEKLH